MVLLAACQDQNLKEFNADPSAEIYSPDPDEEIKEGVYFLASGKVADKDDPIDQLVVTWILDGEPRCADAPPMADGRTECGMSIGADDAEIALFVKDPNEASYQASVQVRSIPASGPTVTIVEPSADQYNFGDKIAFEGVVSDGEDAASALRVWWWSDLDDELDIDLAQDDDGSVVGYYESLSVGTHVLRLWAEDTSGRANSSEVVVNILPEAAAPSIDLTHPIDASVLELGSPVLFQASILDESTPANELTVEWSSSLDGVINTDGSTDLGVLQFSLDSLSEGLHEITLKVTDADGMSSTAQTSFSLLAPSPEDTGTSGDTGVK